MKDTWRDGLTLQEQEQKEDFAMLNAMRQMPSRQARKALAREIGIPWEEYQRIKRKYRHVLARLDNS